MTAPDPTILAEAIKKAEADLQTFRGIDDPEIKKLVEFSEVILVAAKAYQPMREALKELLDAFECESDDLMPHEYEAIVADAKTRARAALNPAGLA